MTCIFCNKIPSLLKSSDPFLVHEFKNSALIIGEHQMFSGYCVLVLKQHAAELFDLDLSIQNEFHQELLHASKAVSKAFSTDKINVASYGNMTPHLHWHIFPRHKTDLAWPKPPWTEMEKFKDYVTTPDTAKKAAQSIQKYL